MYAVCISLGTCRTCEFFQGRSPVHGSGVKSVVSMWPVTVTGSKSSHQAKAPPDSVHSRVRVRGLLRLVGVGQAVPVGRHGCVGCELARLDQLD